MFDQVQVRALAGPLKDIQRLVLKPLLRCLGCVLRVIDLLEGESLPQSELLNRFSSSISLCFATFIFPLILASLSVPPAEKHPHSMMLPPPFFTVGMVPGSSSRCNAWHSGQQVQSWFHQTRESCFSWAESFRCLLANSKWAVKCFLLRSGFHLTTLPYRPGRLLQR